MECGLGELRVVLPWKVISVVSMLPPYTVAVRSFPLNQHMLLLVVDARKRHDAVWCQVLTEEGAWWVGDGSLFFASRVVATRWLR
jgi:hypothetical protein